MQISKTTTHTVTFTVEYFDSNEGGMDNERFGDTVPELKQAIDMLQLANAKEPKYPWVIVCHVDTEIK